MKNFIWIFIIIVLASCSRGNKIEVRGSIENGTGMIFLDIQGLRGIVSADSVKLKKNGSFVLSDRIELPTFYNLHLGDQKIIPLLVSPGESVELNTNSENFLNDYELSGSPESLLLRDLNMRISRTNKGLDSLQFILEKNPEINDEALAGLQEASTKIITSQHRYSIKFVLDHMTSLTSIYALYQRLNNNDFVLNSNRDIQLLKITAASLDTIYPESEFVISLKRDALNMENSFNNQKIKTILATASSTLPEISLPDPYGDTITLSSLKGNVILLSFWASWNEASVELNQDLKRLYNKYHSRGLEVYQVSFDMQLKAWMEAIQFDELPWYNVSELSYPESTVAAFYNVTEIPAFFLIDRSGEIVGKNIQELELDRKISELINQNQ